MEQVTRDGGRGSGGPRRGVLSALVGAFVFFGVLVAATLIWRPPHGVESGVPTAQMAQASIPIEGMSCSACVARVKRTLKSLEGVTAVEVRLAERDARIQYATPTMTPERLVAAINELGYKAGTPKLGG